MPEEIMFVPYEPYMGTDFVPYEIIEAKSEASTTAPPSASAATPPQGAYLSLSTRLGLALGGAVSGTTPGDWRNPGRW